MYISPFQGLSKLFFSLSSLLVFNYLKFQKFQKLWRKKRKTFFFWLTWPSSNSIFSFSLLAELMLISLQIFQQLIFWQYYGESQSVYNLKKRKVAEKKEKKKFFFGLGDRGRRKKWNPSYPKTYFPVTWHSSGG